MSPSVAIIPKITSKWQLSQFSTSALFAHDVEYHMLRGDLFHFHKPCLHLTSGPDSVSLHNFLLPIVVHLYCPLLFFYIHPVSVAACIHPTNQTFYLPSCTSVHPGVPLFSGLYTFFKGYSRWVLQRTIYYFSDLTLYPGIWPVTEANSWNPAIEISPQCRNSSLIFWVLGHNVYSKDLSFGDRFTSSEPLEAQVKVTFLLTVQESNMPQGVSRGQPMPRRFEYLAPAVSQRELMSQGCHQQ